MRDSREEQDLSKLAYSGRQDGSTPSRKRVMHSDHENDQRRQRVGESVSAHAYSANALEVAVEAALSKLFSSNRDDCSFDELYEVRP